MHNDCKRKSTEKVKDPLSFEICIFRTGQAVCDDDRIIVVAMTSTKEKLTIGKVKSSRLS
jgi:hypothetical protein